MLQPYLYNTKVLLQTELIGKLRLCVGGTVLVVTWMPR